MQPLNFQPIYKAFKHNFEASKDLQKHLVGTCLSKSNLRTKSAYHLVIYFYCLIISMEKFVLPKKQLGVGWYLCYYLHASRDLVESCMQDLFLFLNPLINLLIMFFRFINL